MVAKVNKDRCLSCGGCVAICPQDAIKMSSDIITISIKNCINCGICVKFCAFGAITENGED